MNDTNDTEKAPTEGTGKKAPNPHAEALKRANAEKARKAAEKASYNDGQNRGADPNVQNNPATNVSLGAKQKKLTIAEKIALRKQQKRKDMTEEELEMYEAYTDPVTGIPPRDVRGVWGTAIVSN